MPRYKEIEIRDLAARALLPSSAETKEQAAWNARRVARLGVLTALGTAMFILESLIPLPLPFLKIGLANVATLLALALMGPRDALIVVALRVLIGSFVTGSFLGPSFVLSFSAGVTSTAVMSLLIGVPLRRFRLRPVPGEREAESFDRPGGEGRQPVTRTLLGPVGVSLAGSTTHVVTQMGVVSLLYVHSSALFRFLPLLLVTALVGGLVVGVVVLRILPGLLHAAAGENGPIIPLRPRLRAGDWVVAAALLAAIGCSAALPEAAEGSLVTVEHNGHTLGKLDLREDGDLTVDGDRGKIHVQVRGGAVRVSDADCPNRICVRTGWRSRAGDMIVCVPNGTFVRIGASRHPAAITG